MTCLFFLEIIIFKVCTYTVPYDYHWIRRHIIVIRCKWMLRRKMINRTTYAHTQIPATKTVDSKETPANFPWTLFKAKQFGELLSGNNNYYLQRKIYWQYDQRYNIFKLNIRTYIKGVKGGFITRCVVLYNGIQIRVMNTSYNLTKKIKILLL